jgi:hypothetical protein
MPVSALLVPLKQGGVIIDVKSALESSALPDQSYRFWRL